MKKNLLFTICLITLAVIASFIRAKEMLESYNAETQLPQQNSMFLIMIIALSAFVLVAVIVFVIRNQNKTSLKPYSAWTLLELAAAGCLGISAIFNFKLFMQNNKLSILCFSLLAFFAAAAVIYSALTSSQGKKDSHLFFVCIPIFWSCYAMIFEFWSHSSTPIIEVYIFKMFALVCFTIAVNGYASSWFGKNQFKRTGISSSLAVFFSIIVFVGNTIYTLLDGTDALWAAQLSIAQKFQFAFIALHSIAILLATLNGFFTDKTTVNVIDFDIDKLPEKKEVNTVQKNEISSIENESKIRETVVEKQQANSDSEDFSLDDIMNEFKN